MNQIMKNLILLFLVVSFSKIFAQPPVYDFGKQIVIQSTQVSGIIPHTNFPVLIRLNEAKLRTTAFGGSVENSNGYDIIFTLGD